ncbi:MAG TPA: hypothetical protein VHO02_02645 [Fibrobacteria bacterium]|jgi:hypothetical protein|nr:hypothetical protein [Fibrobacteria bacterium]
MMAGFGNPGRPMIYLAENGIPDRGGGGSMKRRRDPEWSFGRRPKHDDFDDLEPFENEGEEVEEDGDDEDEEVDFDNPKFKKSDMWNDYAEDMDFEE